MQRVILNLAAGLCWLSVFVPPSAGAQDAPAPTRVEEIRLDPQSFAGEVRVLEGVVDRLVSREPSTLPAFYLEDDFGHQIMVIPMASPPARGERVRVTGVVSVDVAGDPLITVFEEAGIRPAGASGGAGSPQVSPGGTPGASDTGTLPGDGGGRSPLFWVFLFGGAAAVLFFAYSRGRAAAGPDLITGQPRKEPDIATSALWPESEQTFDGRTMRFARPDPTVQLMSAKLQVVGGADAGEEIRFVSVPGEPVEIMFGRSPGDRPGAVELKQKTVSRTHAVMRHRHDEWLIENLSMTNPTLLNGEELGVKERLLTEGDRIEMGEVVFRFVP